MKKVRTRFAPSPTGMMHIGGLRTCLFAYLFAKKQGGDFILRLEDTDQNRLIPGADKQILESLLWLNLVPDEGFGTKNQPHKPYVQSQRLDRYQSLAADLVERGLAYHCPVSDERYQDLKEEAKINKRAFIFRQEMVENDIGGANSGPIRLKIPREKIQLSIVDQVYGEVIANSDQVEDFVLIKSDGFPTYNFAHIVDDWDMEITHIFRGSEFLSSIPKYLFLYQALDLTPPTMVTCPNILGADGKKKLSKRDQDVNVFEYRQAGYLPSAIINFLSLLGWNPGTTKEYYTLAELEQDFSIDRIQSSPARFDITRLDWFNSLHIRNLSDEEYLGLARQHLPSNFQLDEAYFNQVCLIEKTRINKFSELFELVYYFFIAPSPQEINSKSKLAIDSSMLKDVLNSLTAITDWNQDKIESVIKNYLKEFDIKAKELLMPLRLILTNEEHTPGIYEILFVLGKEESLDRITKYLNDIQ